MPPMKIPTFHNGGICFERLNTMNSYQVILIFLYSYILTINISFRSVR